MKLPALLSAAAFALMTLTTAVNAMPSTNTGALPVGESQVIQVHGCHRSCEWGPALRWHRHVGAACRPIGCYPRAAYPNRCWVDYRGVRHCRW